MCLPRGDHTQPNGRMHSPTTGWGWPQGVQRPPAPCASSATVGQPVLLPPATEPKRHAPGSPRPRNETALPLPCGNTGRARRPPIRGNMNRELGLRVLSGIMGWGTDKAHLEFQRLQLMASLKYDAYRDFEAGVRFVESLASWLQQFELSERETAYELVMNRLVYIGPPEMEKLVGQFYSKFVHPETLATVARELDLPRYSLLTNSRAQQRVSTIRRKSLFLGLSDGARVDFIRHQNVGLISNEQVVGFTQIDDAKWKDLLCELRKDLKSSQATFGSVYLIDDFAGTGTSFFRLHGGEVKGKLARFARSVARAQESLGARIFDPNYKIRIHHYVGTTKARDELTERLTSARTTLDELKLPEDIKTSYGLILPASMPLAPENNDHSVLTPKKFLLSVWPLPRSLATTYGISVDFSSSPYLDVSVQAVPLIYLCIQYMMIRLSSNRIAPFGNLRI